jgi:D-alanine-D-alanine ligase
MSTKHRIGVVRGGIERTPLAGALSLSTGASVLAHFRDTLSASGPRDIFVDRNGGWFVDGRALSPARAFRSVDVVVNALHGSFGEGGQAARYFETFGIPYTGSRSLASAFALHTPQARRHAARLRLRSPQSAVIRAVDNIHEQANNVIREIPFPLLVTPLSGSTARAKRADHFEALLSAIHGAASLASNILVEALQPGQIVAVGIIERFRGERLYALPVVELRHDHVFQEPPEVIYPTMFSPQLKSELTDAARRLHAEIGARHYAQYEFLVTPEGKILFLHARTLPPLAEGAPFTRALEAIGANLGQFLEHLIALTYQTTP